MERSRVQILVMVEICIKISAPAEAPVANLTIISTLTVHCRGKDDMMRERTHSLASYAEAEKIKSLTLHTHGCHSC